MRALPVHLTIDVEAAEARRRGGRVAPPLGYGPRVWGRFDNQARDLGLVRIARDLVAHGLTATFFVEPLGASYFGPDGLRQIVATLLERGQDVQLHLHPTQRAPDALMRGQVPPNDDMSAYDVDEQRRLLELGLSLLIEAGVPRARLVAFRAGNFGANNDTWRACRAAGLRLSSSYDPGYFHRACRMRHPSARPDLFVPHEGIVELPISCVRTARGTLRHLQLTAVSSRELIHALEAMRERRFAAATLVSHSFELYTITDTAGRTGRPSVINARRWRELLSFLARAKDRFPTETAYELAGRIGAAPLHQGATPEPPRTRPLDEVLRHGEQALKRLLPHWASPWLAS